MTLYYQSNSSHFGTGNMIPDKILLTRMLGQSIITLCKEAVAYESRLEVDGIVCITLENESQQIVIKVHELLQRESSKIQNNESCGELPSPVRNRLSNSSSTPSLLSNGQFVNSNGRPERTSLTSCDAFADEDPMRVKTEPMDSSFDVSQSSPMDEDSGEAEDSNQSDFQKFSSQSLSKTSFGYMVPNPIFGMDLPHKARSDPGTPLDRSSRAQLSPDSTEMHQPICCKPCGVYLPNPQAFEDHSYEVHSTFTCSYCFHTFTSKPNLQRHIRLHTGQKPYSCDLCQSRFSRRDDLKGHILKHSYPKPFRCSLCNKGYTDRSCLRNHMRKEHNTTLQHVCSQCGEGFDDLQRSMQHKKVHPELQRFQCNSCNFIGTNSLSHQKHLLSHKFTGKQYTCKKCELPFSDPFEYSDHLKIHRSDQNCSAFACCFCDNVLPSYEQFVRHEHSHVQNKTYSCHICSAQLKNSSMLKLHLSSHKEDLSDEDGYGGKGGSQYWCTECNTGFSSEVNLGEHISSVHENRGQTDNEKTYKSDDSIIKPDHNQNHFKADTTSPVLDADKAHELPVASIPHRDLPMDLSKFEGNSSARRHGEPSVYRPFSSPPFPHPFLSPDKYLSHYNLEHPFPFYRSFPIPAPLMPSPMVIPPRSGSDSVSTEGSVGDSPPANDANRTTSESPSPTLERLPQSTSTSKTFDRITTPEVMFRSRNAVFQCDLCEAQFDTFEGIENHSNQQHKRYLCDYCGNSFTAKPNRDRHVRYHTGERPYRCELCSQCFFRGDDLKYHRTTRHSNHKPHRCTVCGATFAWPKDLDRHVRTHV